MNRHLALATILAALLAVGASGLTHEQEMAFQISSDQLRCRLNQIQINLRSDQILCIGLGAAILILFVIVVVLGCCLCRSDIEFLLRNTVESGYSDTL